MFGGITSAQVEKAIVRTIVEDSPLRRALAEHLVAYKGVTAQAERGDAECAIYKDTASGSQV